MYLISFLLLFSLLAGLAIAAAPSVGVQARRIRFSVGALALASVVLALLHAHSGPEFYALSEGLAHVLDWLFMLGGLGLAVLLLYFCRRIKGYEWYIPALIVVQTGLMLYAELSSEHPRVEHAFYVDSFSVLMALIIAIVGGLICVHAIRYMHDYHAHAAGQHEAGDLDRSQQRPERSRSLFFFMLFLFLAAMFGIVFANNLLWLFFFWEVTTLCSFWLISYSRTDEAIRNGFRALGFNLIGGVSFAAAIVWLTHGPGLRTWELDQLVAGGSALALIPAVLIAVAGLSKSAQMPFSSWLLGAMVAPTPVSALLHSSTMVKAGVFILIKLSPVFHDTFAGLLLSLIGGLTFLVTSLVAVNQRNAKLVLAYSTIANLGLIVMCAGVGTAATMWAAILLILFHAVAKALLFLAVGTTEHLIGSRDIEDMEGLVYRRPAIAAMLLVGMLGMFLAPFGMLLGKYTCFQAFLSMDVMWGDGVLLAVILAFGSAPTLFFWSKWMGKLVAMPRHAQPSEVPIPRDEAIALVALTLLTYVACALFPLADTAFVIPYTDFLASLGLIPASNLAMPWETITLMSLMLAGLFLMPLAFWLRPPHFTEVSGYLSGANVDGSASYRGAMGVERVVESRGYYLSGFIREGTMVRVGLFGCGSLMLVMLMGAVL
ncbi:proton-conducting transporter transmembrane domain-containing protein [Thiocystis violacea]|uniref:proton-conducting transporter transmembrane domain-containing protein n=1 Tax=Thiocystis violacea TaxID=13725 RepID=UPI001908B6D5|nr:proton-conducting transporter membrane subunit [Thiocystis violacea]MBK1721074.1 Na+/H+ antiporter subunit A [Thiocystis violacea]